MTFKAYFTNFSSFHCHVPHLTCSPARPNLLLSTSTLSSLTPPHPCTGYILSSAGELLPTCPLAAASESLPTLTLAPPQPVWLPYGSLTPGSLFYCMSHVGSPISSEEGVSSSNQFKKEHPLIQTLPSFLISFILLYFLHGTHHTR